jgi:hypothetical protein
MSNMIGWLVGWLLGLAWILGMEKAEVIGFGKKQGGRKGEPATPKTR